MDPKTPKPQNPKTPFQLNELSLLWDLASAFSLVINLFQ